MKVDIPGGQLVIDEDMVDESEQEIRSQIREYLAGERKCFDLSYSYPEGSLGKVMRELDEIPYGEIRTYGEVAERAETSAIYVGNCCAENPLPLIVPCHRVVGENKLGGYQAGEEAKRRLLELEE